MWGMKTFALLFCVFAWVPPLEAEPQTVSKQPMPQQTCQKFGAGPCCDPTIAAHLSKSAVFTACGESEATFLGEQGSKDTCKYFFKVGSGKPDDAFVQVYAPPVKEVPDSPQDPFFKWKQIGRVFITEKALSPKVAEMIARSTGLWMPAKGYFVAVNASTAVCTKAQAQRLAPHMK